MTREKLYSESSRHRKGRESGIIWLGIDGHEVMGAEQNELTLLALRPLMLPPIFLKAERINQYTGALSSL